jgi:hypothetical protein
MRIAIVGTVGHGDDGQGLTVALWRAMQADAHKQIEGEQRAAGVTAANTTLVAGGAPGADHLAVRLWRAGLAETLELHLPAALGPHGFDQNDETGVRIAESHWAFRRQLGVASVDELVAAAQDGARVCNANGFLARREAIAAAADTLIAYTLAPASDVVAGRPGEAAFADPADAGLSAGDTAETWRLAHRAGRKTHVPLKLLVQTLDEAG